MIAISIAETVHGSTALLQKTKSGDTVRTSINVVFWASECAHSNDFAMTCFERSLPVHRGKYANGLPWEDDMPVSSRTADPLVCMCGIKHLAYNTTRAPFVSTNCYPCIVALSAGQRHNCPATKRCRSCLFAPRSLADL